MQEYPGKQDFLVQMKWVSFWISSEGVKPFSQPLQKADSDLWIPVLIGCRFNKEMFLLPKSIRGISCEKFRNVFPLLLAEQRQFFPLRNLQ